MACRCGGALAAAAAAAARARPCAPPAAAVGLPPRPRLRRRWFSSEGLQVQQHQQPPQPHLAVPFQGGAVSDGEGGLAPAQEAPSRPRWQSSLAGHNAVLRNLSDDKEESGARAEQWLQQMLDSGVEPSVQSYNHVLKAWAKDGNPAAAESWVMLMKERNMAPNVYSYTMLVKAYTRSGDVDSAEGVLARMRQEGVEANHVTYTNLIDVLAKQGDFARAEKWLKDMEAHGSTPAPSPYNTLMSTYTKAGDFESAERIWARAEVAYVKPDIVSYTTLMQLRIATGNIPSAEQLLQEMLADASIRPTVVPFNVLLQGYAKEGRVDKAFAVIEQLRALNIQTTTPTHNIMIQVCAKADRLAEAEEWFHTFARGPNVHSFGSMMDGYARMGHVSRCRELLEQMQALGLAPNRVIWNTFIKAHTVFGDLKGAAEVLDQMMANPDPELQPDNYSFHTLFYALLRKGQLQEAEDLLPRMRASGIEPNEQLQEALAGAQQQRSAMGVVGGSDARQDLGLSVPEGVDWVEVLGPGGVRLGFRSCAAAGGELVQESPSSGLVLLQSEHGPYYWDVATNTTSWEKPGGHSSAASR